MAYNRQEMFFKLYDPETGDELWLPRSVDLNYYVLKGYMSKKPSQDIIEKCKIETENERKNKIKERSKKILRDRIMVEEDAKIERELKDSIKKEIEAEIRAEIEAEAKPKPKRKRRSSEQVASDKAKQEEQKNQE